MSFKKWFDDNYSKATPEWLQEHRPYMKEAWYASQNEINQENPTKPTMFNCGLNKPKENLCTHCADNTDCEKYQNYLHACEKREESIKKSQV